METVSTGELRPWVCEGYFKRLGKWVPCGRLLCYVAADAQIEAKCPRCDTISTHGAVRRST